MGPFAYVDSLIEELEAMHLDGLRAVPAEFLPRLLAVNRLLPQGVEPILGWRRLIRDVIGQCFELQEQLLAVRDPSYAAYLEAEEQGEADLRYSAQA